MIILDEHFGSASSILEGEEDDEEEEEEEKLEEEPEEELEEIEEKEEVSTAEDPPEDPLEDPPEASGFGSNDFDNISQLIYLQCSNLLELLQLSN